MVSCLPADISGPGADRREAEAAAMSQANDAAQEEKKGGKKGKKGKKSAWLGWGALVG